MVMNHEARSRYVQGELNKLRPGEYPVKIKLFSAGGNTFHLNITAKQLAAIEKILVPEPEVDYAPCIMGKVIIGDTTTEFMLPMLNESVTFSQWGANGYVLGSRVDLMEALAEAAGEWAQDMLCRTCKENLTDDGEGYNGECGDCADRNESNKEEGDDE